MQKTFEKIFLRVNFMKKYAGRTIFQNWENHLICKIKPRISGFCFSFCLNFIFDNGNPV